MTLNQIKETIKRERKLAGLSQEDMAKKLDIYQVAYSKFEAKGKPIPVKRLKEIVHVLGIDDLDSFDDPGPKGLEEDIKEVLKDIAESLRLMAGR